MSVIGIQPIGRGQREATGLKGTTEIAEFDTPQLLTVKEARERLGLGHTKIMSLIATGELPSVKIGRARRIDAIDIHRFVDANRVILD